MKWFALAMIASAGVAFAMPASATIFGYTGAEVTYTAPSSGVYSILAFGAEGGRDANGIAGGDGAEAGGDFSLFSGEMLSIIVGGAGSAGGPGDFFNNGGGGGGGGGTFVLGPNGLLVGAGGGGGGGSVAPEAAAGGAGGAVTAGPGGDGGPGNICIPVDGGEACGAAGSGGVGGGVLPATSAGGGNFSGGLGGASSVPQWLVWPVATAAMAASAAAAAVVVVGAFPAALGVAVAAAALVGTMAVPAVTAGAGFSSIASLIPVFAPLGSATPISIVPSWPVPKSRSLEGTSTLTERWRSRPRRSRRRSH